MPVERLPHGRSLAIEDRAPFSLHFGFDGWQRIEDQRAERTPFGLWSVVLDCKELAQFGELNFTRRYESDWENLDHVVRLSTGAAAALPEFVPVLSRRNAA